MMHPVSTTYLRCLRTVSQRTRIPPRQLHDGIKNSPAVVQNVVVVVDALDGIHRDPTNVLLDVLRVIYCVSIVCKRD